MNNHARVPIGVFGASGYVGQELLRLLVAHPGASIAFATAESAAGEVVEGHTLVRTEDAPLGRAELVFSCLPHGVSGRYVEAVRAAGRRAVDLSADFRLKPEAVYGLTEVARARVADAPLVANPGCYPTAALLALIPLARCDLIASDGAVIVDAASGVTGAGRSLKREYLFGEVAEDYRAYGAGNAHRHVPELRSTLAREGGFAGDLVFTPHLLPIRRGILETIHVPLAAATAPGAVLDLLQDTYRGEPCVQVLSQRLPSLRDVVYRNRVAIGVVAVADVARPRVTLVAAIDNLVKGAAGQAVQNMNVMLGFAETTGLAC